MTELGFELKESDFRTHDLHHYSLFHSLCCSTDGIELGSPMRLQGPVLFGYYDIGTAHRSGHRRSEIPGLPLFQTLPDCATGQMWSNLEGGLLSAQEGTSGLGNPAMNSLISHSRRESQYLFLSVEPKAKAKNREFKRPPEELRARAWQRSTKLFLYRPNSTDSPAQGWTSCLGRVAKSSKRAFSTTLTSPNLIPSWLSLQLLP